jgi:hypothetical protein
VSETGSALRATSDALMADLETLESLEEQKRQLPPGDPQLLELATAVEEIARRLLGKSVRQRELSAVAQQLARAGSRAAPGTSIADTPREIHLILSDWRDAERRARAAEPGSAEALAAEDDLDRFREEYRSAHEAASTRR